MNPPGCAPSRSSDTNASVSMFKMEKKRFFFWTWRRDGIACGRERATRRPWREVKAEHDLCVFCHDGIDSDETQPGYVVTVCNHIFHSNCWTKYSNHHQGNNFESNADHSDAVLNTVKLLEATAGPPCPICNRLLPMNHMICHTRACKRKSQLDGVIDMDASYDRRMQTARYLMEGSIHN